MKDERAEAGTKKKAPRRAAPRAAKKAPAAAPRRSTTGAASSSHTNSKKRSTRPESLETSAAERPPVRARQAPITEEQRQAMVAECAYYKAQRRGFRGGDPQQDWYEAESEVDALILRGDEES